MNNKFLMVGAAMLTMLPVTAQAAVVTKSIEVTSLFEKGPLSKVTTTFDFPSDFMSYQNQNVKIENYTSNGGASYANALAFYSYSPAVFTSLYGIPSFTSERRVFPFLAVEANFCWPAPTTFRLT